MVTLSIHWPEFASMLRTRLQLINQLPILKFRHLFSVLSLIIILTVSLEARAQEQSKLLHVDRAYIRIEQQVYWNSEISKFSKDLKIFNCYFPSGLINFYFGASKNLFSNLNNQQIYLLKLFHLNKIKQIPLIKLTANQLRKCQKLGELSNESYRTLLSIEKSLVDRVSSIVDVELAKKVEDLRDIIGGNKKVLEQKKEMIYRELLSKHISNYLLFVDSKNSHYVYK